MYKAVIVLLFFSLNVHAHQADAATIMLVERENGNWILQVSAALTAFQYEIKANYSDQAYKTPEEFKEMVIQHMKKNLSFVFNNDASLQINSSQVKLGHETRVVFEVSGIPESIQSIVIKNNSFKGIHKNQSIVLIFKNGFSKESFVLNEANKHMIKLKPEGNTFVAEHPEIKIDYTSLYVVGGFVFLLGGKLFLDEL